MNLFSKEEIENTLLKLDEWKKQNKSIIIVADIGGTNTRICFTFLESKIGDFLIMPYKKINSSRKVVELFQQLSESIQNKFKIHAGVIATGGRVLENGTIGYVTNFPLPEENQKMILKELPSNLFPEKNSIFINDLEGCCFGLLFLNQNKHLNQFYQPLWKGKEIILEDNSEIVFNKSNILVLGMGTGFGVGLMLYSGYDSKYYVIPTEFGHSIINLKNIETDKNQFELINYISNQKYQGKHSIEYGDICSGPGLVMCYNYLVQKMGLKLEPIDAATISKKSMIDEPKDEYSEVCKQAQTIHYNFLFRLASNLCVSLQCKTIFLVLDNQVKNDKFVTSKIQEFHHNFLDHPKNNWLIDVNCFRQISADENLNITFMGCLHFSQQFFSKQN
ncbi:glucokinase [Anaeramoeba ignava]|uniref:Glucokinase n=1 Tax=Anaeramoeba ignava TaxID=1746090 RepID=A0A9Q0LM20_ANAIG|nr:glucokinase [Anaeramoeba ignava]